MPLRFADATSSFEDAEFVIFGVPFDRTSSFRSGSRFAPNAIREASYNFETYLHEHSVDLDEVKTCDMGNLGELGNADSMVEEVEARAGELVKSGKFPIVLGGEHSIAPPVVKALKGPNVVVVDAHLDFRTVYLGEKNSHACTTRRISEIVGPEKVIPLGVRSMSAEEKRDAKELGLNYILAEEIDELGFEQSVEIPLRKFANSPIHLSIDMDGIDPAYAPGVGTPEPFGITPRCVKKLISLLSPTLVGLDISEVSPPYDNGNTSALAARLVRETVAAVHRSRRA